MKVEELQVNITNQNITDLWNDPDNEILEWGFLALPRTLIWLHRPMGITSNELVFIITIHSLNDMGKKNILDREIAGYNFNKLSDEIIEEIKQVVSFLKIKSSKEYRWERRCLEKKGYLKTTVAKAKYDMNTKRFIGQGVEYDFTGLITALKEVKRIIKENAGKRKKSKQENTSETSQEKIKSKKDSNKNNTTKNEAQNKYDELILKNFLSAYCKMHKELLNIELNFNKKTKQKEYVVKIYESIDAKKVDYKDVLEKARSLFEKLGDIGKTSLAFQDTVARAVAFTNSKKNTASNTVNDKTKKSIPSAESLFGRNKK